MLFNKQIKNLPNPRKGYNTTNESYYFYGRYAEVLYYDPFFKTVDVVFLDNRYDKTKIPVLAGFDQSPSIGDIVLVTNVRDNFASSDYVVIGKINRSSQAKKLGALYWNGIEKRYDFDYQRSDNSKDYSFHSDFSEFFMNSSIGFNSGSASFELDSVGSSIYSNSITNTSVSSGSLKRSGPVVVESTFFNEGSVEALGPDILTHSENPLGKEMFSNNFLNEDSSFNAFVNADYSYKLNLEDDSLEVFNSDEVFLKESSPLTPLKADTSDIFDQCLFKPLSEYKDSFFLTEGRGTKTGSNLDDFASYGKVVARSLFSDLRKAVEESQDYSEVPLEDKSKNFISIAFWRNLFQKGKEVFFSVIDKKGSLKAKLSSVNPEDGKRTDSSLELYSDGYNLVRLGKSDIPEVSPAPSQGEQPSFENNDRDSLKGDSLFLRSESSLNFQIDGKDSASTGIYMDLKESDLKLNIGGEYHLYVDGYNKNKFNDLSYRFYEDNDYKEGKGNHVSEFLGDSVFSSNSSTISVEQNEAIVLNFGGTVDRDSGSVSGGNSITITSAGNQVTVDWGGSSVNFMNASQLTTDHYISANYGSTPAAKRGDMVTFSGSADVHANHRIQNPPSSVGVSESSGGLNTRT